MANWCSIEMGREHDMIVHSHGPRANSRTSTIRSPERCTRPQYRHLRGAFWTLVDQGVISLGTFLLNIQLARHLGAPEYGVFALLLGGYFIVQHINGSLIYYPLMLKLAAGRQERSSDLVSTSVAMMAASSLVCSAAVVACLFALGRRDIAAAAALYLVLWQFQDLSRRTLLAEFHHRAAAAIDGVTYIGAAGAVAVLANYGSLTLSTALSAMAGSCAVALVVHALRHRPTLPTTNNPREILHDSWMLGQWAFLNGIVSIASVQIFPWALAIFDGPAATAGFQAVMNIANIANPVVFGLCNIILPAVAQSHEEGGAQEAWRTAQTFILIGAALLLLCAIPLVFLPRTVLLLFYGANSPYASLYHAVPIVVLAAAVNSLADMVSAYIHGVKAPKLAVWMNLIGFATAALVLPLIGSVSVVGCAVGLAVARTVRAIAAWRLIAGIAVGSGGER
jgi:O-antigen/teichoic acid export membrane protein